MQGKNVQARLLMETDKVGREKNYRFRRENAFQSTLPIQFYIQLLGIPRASGQHFQSQLRLADRGYKMQFFLHIKSPSFCNYQVPRLHLIVSIVFTSYRGVYAHPDVIHSVRLKVYGLKTLAAGMGAVTCRVDARRIRKITSVD